jgi:hypothetical protein
MKMTHHTYSRKYIRKLIFSLSLLMIVIFLIMTTNSYSQAIKGPGGNYWPLYCKTGPNIKIEIDNAKRLRLFIEPINVPAKTNFSGLKSGTCSWPDRTLRKDELQGYYGEVFAQWECPMAVLAGPCLTPKLDSTTNQMVSPVPFFRDPTGRKFKIWLQKKNKFMQILGETSPRIEFVN